MSHSPRDRFKHPLNMRTPWTCEQEKHLSILAGHPFFEQISAYFVSHLFKLPSQHTITDILNIWVSCPRSAVRRTSPATIHFSSVKPFKRCCRDRSVRCPALWYVDASNHLWNIERGSTRKQEHSESPTVKTYLRAFRFIAFALSLLPV